MRMRCNGFCGWLLCAGLACGGNDGSADSTGGTNSESSSTEGSQVSDGSGSESMSEASSGADESSTSSGDGDAETENSAGDGDATSADGDGSTSETQTTGGDGDGGGGSESGTSTGAGDDTDWLLMSYAGDLYRVDRLSAAATQLCELVPAVGGGSINFSSMTFTRDDRLLGSTGDRLFEVALPDCIVTELGNYGGGINGMNGISPDEAFGLFGIDTTTNSVYRINPDTAEITEVGPAGINVGANGATWLEPETRLLAVDSVTDTLYEVDTANGSFSELGPLSIPLVAIGFEYHPQSEVMYLCSNNSAAGLYELETSGAMSFVGPIVDEGQAQLNCNDLAAAWAAPDVPLPE